MKKIELLAPAGSYEALVAAVQNGANAIYLGGNAFSARAFATNFSREELKKAVIYAHLRNVKIYVTVNTLYEDNQFENLKDYLLFLATIDVDALIIQDVGLLHFVKKYFPDFEIHMSTQTSIYNLSAVKYFEELGVDRIVLARENSIEEIKNICNNTDLDIEVFVHGALCMSYSGQCLMSSMIAKRSGNKGACGQPCRLAYKLEKDGKNLDSVPSYLLSPRDLCTLDNIGILIEAGITSFKIEGRMKRPEYVAVIVKQYREAIDVYLKKQELNDVNNRIIEMKQMFNRGFTKGYLLHDNNFMAKEYPGNRGIDLGTVVDYDKKRKVVKIKLLNRVKQGDRISFKSTDFVRTITKLFLNQKLVNQANKNSIVEIELNTAVKKGESVYKIIDIELIEKAKTSYQKEQIKNPITMHFSGQINNYATLKIYYRDTIIEIKSNQVIEAATSAPLSKEHIKNQLAKLGNTIFVAEKINIEFPENAFLSLKEINEMRRQAIDKLIVLLTSTKKHNINIVENNRILTNKTIKGIYVRVHSLIQLNALIDQDIKGYYFPLSKHLDEAIQLAKKHQKKVIPFINFLNNEKQLMNFKNSNSYQEIDEILVGDYGALKIFNDKKCILDATFNLYNSYALEHFKDYNAILSLEMSKKQINNLTNISQNITMIAYGKTINMHIKHCLISEHYFKRKKIGCNKCKEGNYKLVDRKGEKFEIQTDELCNNLIYNNHCIYIKNLDTLKVDYILLSFLNEDAKTVKFIFEEFKHILSDENRQIPAFIKHTSGYYND
ncbi:U32 family peptidase [Thomasclavelia cocleata]|uniref:U32 family peptidase n=6 Tax=Thomasclavelia cocleata TaxID=69824 RepID=UPI00242B277E|nr:U32 family peptidase [Thomasclavelia cocleata]